MKFKPTITDTFVITDELVSAHLDEFNTFDWKAAGIGGDYALGLAMGYFPIVGRFKASSNDDRVEWKALIEKLTTIKTSTPHMIVNRGMQVDVFAFDKNIFALAFLARN